MAPSGRRAVVVPRGSAAAPRGLAGRPTVATGRSVGPAGAAGPAGGGRGRGAKGLGRPSGPRGVVGCRRGAVDRCRMGGPRGGPSRTLVPRVPGAAAGRGRRHAPRGSATGRLRLARGAGGVGGAVGRRRGPAVRGGVGRGRGSAGRRRAGRSGPGLRPAPGPRGARLPRTVTRRQGRGRDPPRRRGGAARTLTQRVRSCHAGHTIRGRRRDRARAPPAGGRPAARTRPR